MSPSNRHAVESAVRRAQAAREEQEGYSPPVLPPRPAHLVVWYGDIWACICGQRFDTDRGAENHYFVHH